MLCEGKIGCHNCLNYLQTIEAKLNGLREAIKNGSQKVISMKTEDALAFIEAFKKGG
jgi:hypothetical protein